MDLADAGGSLFLFSSSVAAATAVGATVATDVKTTVAVAANS